MKSLQIVIRKRCVVQGVRRGEPALGPKGKRLVKEAGTAAQGENGGLDMGLGCGD